MYAVLRRFFQLSIVAVLLTILSFLCLTSRQRFSLTHLNDRSTSSEKFTDSKTAKTSEEIVYQYRPNNLTTTNSTSPNLSIGTGVVGPPIKRTNESSQWERSYCSEPHCMNHLNEFDLACMKWCNNRAFRNKTVQMKGECRFMSGEGRAPVALTSLPGSGNTWVRGLLEKATGICTGSLYCDSNLRKSTFNAEGVRTGSVLVFKTHRSKYKWTTMDQPESLRPEQAEKWAQPRLGAIIVLVRNPYHAMVSEWNRKHSNRTRTAASTNNTLDIASHLGVVNNQQYFGGNATWRSFIKKSIANWINYIKNAILESPDNVPKLVVRYEDFQRDRVREVSRVLDFLHFPHSLETLSQRLEEDFSVFHRKRHPQFQAYTVSQELFIDHSLRELLDRLSRGKRSETFGIEKYCRNSTTYH